MKKVSFSKLKKIYENSLKIRILEETISREYKKNKMRCPTHLSIGQEIVAASVGILSKREDYFISYHRSHAHYLSKGGDIIKFIHELHGLSTGCSKGIGGSMHLIDLKKNFYGSTAIVSSCIPIGVGLALSKQLSKETGIVFIFIGDASIEEGVFFEALNFVILKNLPVIFVCENNSFSVYTHLSKRQPRGRKIYKLVESFGIKSFFANQSETIKMINTINKVISFSKFSKKPAFIEIKNFRYLEHCGPNDDDNLNYRNNREISFWKKNDAVFILEKYLVKLDKTFDQKKFKDSFIKFVNRIFRKIYMNNKANKINLKNLVYKKT